ncbi:MAG TPA: AarF/UbiB family protein [Polyangia bacterium]|jgi:predicted unusual protein kinase regulating ubiquinone biosynthesis (AarF/ABC1/UbiB family)
MRPTPEVSVAAAPPVALTAPSAPGRAPLGPFRRILKAHWVTFVVIVSYLSVKLQSRFRSAGTIDRILEEKHRRNARRIERALVRLQGLFIKVGQLISIMTNFLPEAFRSELEGLQDQVPPRPYADIERRLREEYSGRPPEEVFAEFSRVPVASASIAQVHRARLTSGEQVAVKVQYPDIEEIVRADLRTLRRIFKIIAYFVPYRGLDQVYKEIRETVLQELDFRSEADNVNHIAANFVGRTDVLFPKVWADYSTARVLTTSWIDGVKITDLPGLDRLGIDRTALARLVVTSYCKQIFSDGLYHADPHPGNIIVQAGEDGPHIVFIDFGAVCMVSQGMREGIVQFLQGAVSRDVPKIVDAMKAMGFIPKNADPAVYDRVVEFFHDKFHEELQIESFNLKDVKFDPSKGLENLADLRNMDISLRDITDSFHVPRQWIMLERTVLILMGLCTELDPQMSPATVIRPYLEEFVLGKEKDWSSFVMNTTKEVALSAISLPSELKKFMTRASRGEIELRWHNLEETARLIYTLGHQLIYTLVMLTSAVLGYFLDERGHERQATIAAWVAGACALLLVGSVLGARGKLKKKRR